MNQAAKPNIPVKRKKRWATLDDLQLLLLSLPTTIWYLLFSYIPMFGILIAFKKYKVRPGKGFLWSLIHNSPWCGLDNFKFLFSSNSKTTIAMFIKFVLYGLGGRATEGGLSERKKYENCKLLVIDDLGAECITQYSVSSIASLIDLRIVNGRKTIISTNLTPDKIRKTYGERTYSRLLGEFRVLKFMGKDIRMQKIKGID